MGGDHGAVAFANGGFALKENFYHKPKEAWKRFENAPAHFERREIRDDLIDERAENLSEIGSCHLDSNSGTAFCRSVKHAQAILAPVERHLAKVKNPDGLQEKLNNAARRGNRRDKQALSEATELLDEAEAMWRSRQMLLANSAPPQAPPSYNAAINTGRSSYEPKQDWNNSRSVQGQAPAYGNGGYYYFDAPR